VDTRGLTAPVHARRVKLENGVPVVTAVRAHLLEMTGDHAAARACYREAAGQTANLPVQRYPNARAGRLDAAARPGG
jgi:hypothetical protein